MSKPPTESTALLGGEEGPPPAYTPAHQNAPPPYPNAPDAQKPPQVGYHTGGGTTVVVTQPVVTQPVVFRDYPVFIVDSQGRQVQTVLEYRTGSKAHLMCFLICCLGFLFFFPAMCCCWIPYFLDSAKDVYHINPTDGTVVGVYRRM